MNRLSPHGQAALNSVMPAGAGDLEGCTAKAMLLDTTSTCDGAEWDTAATLDAFTTLGEYGTPPATRKTVANLVVSVVGTTVKIDFDDIVYATLAATSTLEHVLIYFEKASAAVDPAETDRVPYCILELANQPDGGQYTVAVPVGGFVVEETA